MSLWAKNSRGETVSITQDGGVSSGRITDTVYCPSCRCRMSFVSESSNKRTAHFQGHHRDGCDIGYTSANDSFNVYEFTHESIAAFLEKLKEDGVRTNQVAIPDTGNDQAVASIIEQSSIQDAENLPIPEKEKMPIQTLRQFFGALANSDPNHVLYEQTTVKDIFCGRSTAFLYTRYINGTHLVYAQFHGYDRANKTFYFHYPSENTVQIKLAVMFDAQRSFDVFLQRHHPHVHDYFVMIADFSYNRATLESLVQIIRLG